MKISWKAVQSFLRNDANRQTNRQSNGQQWKHNLRHGVGKKLVEGGHSPLNLVYEWMKNYKESNSYLSLHGDIVKEVVKLLGVFMNNHDLTKSRVAQIALGFLWQWVREQVGSEKLSGMKETELDCISAGYLEVENHHTKHEKASVGCVNIHKLFIHYLSVHLQKD